MSKSLIEIYFKTKFGVCPCTIKKKKKLKLGKSSRHMSSFFNARMLQLSCVTVWLPNVFRKGFCAVLWPPPSHHHHHHKLWNTYYMELKHLTEYELYTGLQLFPVQATGVYPIVWSSPDRVYTCFLQEYSVCYPDRVLHTTRPGLFPYHLLSRPGL